MHLKISNLTNLQDARYSAALGFDLVSFSLERGSVKKLPAPSVWSMIQWLDGPGVVLELNVASLDELQELSFDPRYLSFPLEEWNEFLWNYGSAILLRGDAEADPEQMKALLALAMDAERELKFELCLSGPEQLVAFQELYPHIFVNFSTLETTRAFIRSEGSKPYGISFRDEAEEEPNQLDYEVLDELMAVYSDVHL